MVKIAVDAMGGDNAPQAIVEGVALARKDFPEIEFILYGKEPEIKKYLSDLTNITIVHTDEKIESDDEPVKSIRRKKQASMVLAAQAVKNGEADAVLSAGNTGALLASGLFIVGRIKNIERPGLMSTLPVFKGDSDGFDFIDMGANADNKPEHLLTYAVLGTFYAKNVRQVTNPRVGLLNNGTEATKGSELTKAAYDLLAASSDINFVGNIEARDLFNGVADVVVTDGFTGNAVLKTMEGTAMSMMSVLKESVKESGFKGKMGALMMKDSLMNLKNQMDYSNHGGAVLFGLKGAVIKCHGSSDPESIKSAVRQINQMQQTNVIHDLRIYFEDKTTN
ncbi:phosphate acyltransferase [Vagococcus penaei]|uniref:Phosphate acyltransferase n=1 Tax=Vagococcus penaei TaxID=633807 RepID=A0A1Q2D6M4_9ENTE|nr:phosphate acyltransferase PlsX [Vagococcus penaei]AQP54069.1 phosphate acyltransferase [Vagococcus penaei]RSU01698.1 phosphate acyltransferase [Vagococcus penaei]